RLIRLLAGRSSVAERIRSWLLPDAAFAPPHGSRMRTARGHIPPTHRRVAMLSGVADNAMRRRKERRYASVDEGSGRQPAAVTFGLATQRRRDQQGVQVR